MTNEPKHIIAIGASAGGVEEIHHFFDITPLDGVAYVIIQHLSPDYKSRMVELLDKHTSLAVKEAEDGMLIEKNVVYLTPSHNYMTVANSSLQLTTKEDAQRPHLTINAFFTSLAQDQGSKAIGIILSGMGSDGSEGVKAIKKAGGLAMVRNPETTQFNSMPSHAIATGVVDFVLEPELMPQTIIDYVNNVAPLEASLSEITKDEKHMDAIIELVNSRHPMDFSEYKSTTILRRIKRRAAHHQFDKLINYLQFLKANPDEVQALAQEFLISVSSFFRDAESFEFIRAEVITTILKQLSPDEEIKLWVAGCTTGEEAYSLAMLLCEQLTGEHKNTIVKNFATDVDDVALAQASKGLYSDVISKQLSPERLETHFTQEGNNYRVKPDIRKMLIFAHHDVVKNPPYCNMHFISCRNMLIYMTPVLQKKIYQMLLFGVKKDGYIFLGPSENPMSIFDELDVVNKKWKIYKVKELNRTVRFNGFWLPTITDIKTMPLLPLPAESKGSSKENLGDVVSKALLEELGHTVVCIDQHNHVVQTFGDTTKYLLQKNFTLNLAELLPKPLAIAFASATRKALQSNEKILVKSIQVEKNPVPVNLLVKPLQLNKLKRQLLLVIFSDDNTQQLLQHGEVFDKKIYLDDYVVNLEEELRELRDELHSTFEKLDASNENMQTFNEELLAANEEMQSTNEEMQSINEELHTINTDYQAKNKELVEINEDLNNYFRSNINGQLFVNRDMLLMKFSPGTVKHINLLETDIGRPLSNISTNIRFKTF